MPVASWVLLTIRDFISRLELINPKLVILIPEEDGAILVIVVEYQVMGETTPMEVFNKETYNWVPSITGRLTWQILISLMPTVEVAMLT